MRLLLIIISILLLPCLVTGASLQTKAVEQALRDVGQVVEKSNRNDHPRIDEYLRLIGLPKGSPYCTSAVVTWYNEASLFYKLQNPIPRVGAGSALWRTGIKNPVKYKLIRSKDILLGADLLPGDIVIWREGTLPESRFLHGHTAILRSQISNKEFYSIDANTSKSNIESEQREQLPNSKNFGGVYIKRRAVNTSAKLNLIGVIRIR